MCGMIWLCKMHKALSLRKEVFIADLTIHTDIHFEQRGTDIGRGKKRRQAYAYLQVPIALCPPTTTLSFRSPLGLASFLSPTDADCTILLDDFRSGVLEFWCLISIRVCFSIYAIRGDEKEGVSEVSVCALSPAELKEGMEERVHLMVSHTYRVFLSLAIVLPIHLRFP